MTAWEPNANKHVAAGSRILFFQRVPKRSLSSLIGWLRVRVKFSLGVRVSGMIRVRVDVEVRVRVSNLLGAN